MIIYDSKKWGHLAMTIVKTFRESYNLKQLAVFMGIVTAYAAGTTWMNIHYLEEVFKIDTVFFSLVGVILSLFLVFRLNSAYDRWWEGRKLWGKLVNDSRTLAMNLDILIDPGNKARRKFFVRNIANFAKALQWHLRDQKNMDEMIHINKRYAEDIESVDHVPNKVVSIMYHEIQIMYEEKKITDWDKDRLYDLLRSMVDVLGGCERIKKTPIPFSHSTFIKLFVIIYLAILPFGLVHIFGYLTIPAVMIMGFAMLGVEVISEEIENPFGLDANDLPTGSIADGIRESVYEIMHVQSSFVEHKREQKEADVLH